MDKNVGKQNCHVHTAPTDTNKLIFNRQTGLKLDYPFTKIKTVLSLVSLCVILHLKRRRVKWMNKMNNFIYITHRYIIYPLFFIHAEICLFTHNNNLTHLAPSTWAVVSIEFSRTLAWSLEQWFVLGQITLEFIQHCLLTLVGKTNADQRQQPPTKS